MDWDMEMLPEPASPKQVGTSRTYGGNRAFHNFANDYSHISDPNLRRRLALSEIDKVPFGLYHIRAVIVAGVGFFTDSYDIFAISMVTSLLGMVYWGGSNSDPHTDAMTSLNATETARLAMSFGYESNNGRLPDPVNQALKASTSAGIIVGQVVFGWLADVFGRRRMYGMELGIIVLSTLNCALASSSPSMTSTGMLVFWRVMMGVGIGGDYPLSSVITSEFAPTRWRGAMMASVFSMQGIGQLASAIVALVVTAAMRSDFVSVENASMCGPKCRVSADRAWRIIIGVGAIPACLALYYRITIPETPRYTFDVAHDVEKADADIRAYMASQNEGTVDPVVQARMKRVAGPSMSVPNASWADVFAYFRPWKTFKVLLGTTLSWFFLDLAFYGLALNNSVVLEAIGYSTGKTLYHVLYNNAVGTIILACAGSIPGYWTAVATIDTLGRKPLQVYGFLVLTVLFCILGFAFHRLSEGGMLALYVVAQFFFNWGPNTTTFIIPGECYPTRYRSTGHGLSAAMGKLGAILAQVISIPILSKDRPPNCFEGSSDCSPWINRLMQIFALFMFCGTVISLFCVPETKGVTLEELAGEAPTSYNAGRNGSISDEPRPPPKLFRRWHMDLFGGGRPAGFFYPRVQTNPNKKNKRRRRHGGGDSNDSNDSDELDPHMAVDDGPRIGIMTSPEIAAQDKKAHRNRSTNSRRGLLGALHNKNGHDTDLSGASTAVNNNKTDSIGSSSHSTYIDGHVDGLTPPPAAALSGPGGQGGPGPGPSPGPGPGGPGVFPGWGAGWGRIDRGGKSTPLEDIRLQDVGSLLK